MSVAEAEALFMARFNLSATKVIIFLRLAPRRSKSSSRKMLNGR
jgi:hypothetical protein